MGTDKTTPTTQDLDTIPLSVLLDKLVQPQIPITVDLWGPKEAASYFKVCPRQFTDRISHMPGFPKPVRLPTERGSGHPRWKAIDIIRWTEKLAA